MKCDRCGKESKYTDIIFFVTQGYIEDDGTATIDCGYLENEPDNAIICPECRGKLK